MKKMNVSIIDQYGQVSIVEALGEHTGRNLQELAQCIYVIHVDGEHIRPSFDFHFVSQNSGKIYMLS